MLVMKNMFKEKDAKEIIKRINKLTPETNRKWGEMDVAQMLAHCNVTYEMIFTDKHPKPKGLKKFMMKKFVKPIVTNERPYKKNSPTAKSFKIANEMDFQEEKKRLIDHITETQKLGTEHFEGLESNSFGKLSSREWNNMFYKHLDHHLQQFGV